jgi:hypothetical protein
LFNDIDQNETGSDGVGDIPYVVNENCTDHYPLINPWMGSPKGLAFLEPADGSTMTGPITVVFIIENKGNDTEFLQGDPYNRIDLEVEYSEPSVHGIQLWSTSYDGLVLPSGERYVKRLVYSPLESGNATARLVHWKFKNGGYDIGEFGEIDMQITLLSIMAVSIDPVSTSTYAGHSITFTSTVSGGMAPYTCQWYVNETQVAGAISNNWTFTPQSAGNCEVYLSMTDSLGNTARSDEAYVTVTLPLGDLNYDGRVDMKDIGTVASAFGAFLGHPRWNLLADQNVDGRIDLRDVAIAAKHFGEHYP